MIVATSLIAALGGCAATSGSREQSKPDIGAAPAYAIEVRVAAPVPGESALLVAARERQARLKANKIIRCLVRDRELTRATFLGVAAPASTSCARPADAVKGRRRHG